MSDCPLKTSVKESAILENMLTSDNETFNTIGSNRPSTWELLRCSTTTKIQSKAKQTRKDIPESTH